MVDLSRCPTRAMPGTSRGIHCATVAWQTNGIASSMLAGAAREPLLAHELRIGATGAGATSSGAVARLAGGLFRRCAAT